MTERVIARPATSFLLMFIAALGFLLLLDGPARAHHRSDHGNGKDSVATGSTDAARHAGTRLASAVMMTTGGYSQDNINTRMRTRSSQW